MPFVPILRLWKWSGLLVRKAVTIVRIPGVSEKRKSHCIEFNYSNNTFAVNRAFSYLFRGTTAKSEPKKTKYVSVVQETKLISSIKFGEQRGNERKRGNISFIYITHLCVVSWPRLVSVYGPFLILRARSLHKEWYSIHWRLGANRVTFLKGWCSWRWIEVWNELNRTVWSGLVRSSKMKHINGLRVKCGHNLYNEPQS